MPLEMPLGTLACPQFYFPQRRYDYPRQTLSHVRSGLKDETGLFQLEINMKISAEQPESIESSKTMIEIDAESALLASSDSISWSTLAIKAGWNWPIPMAVASAMGYFLCTDYQMPGADDFVSLQHSTEDKRMSFDFKKLRQKYVQFM
jgi:hypothetical protein